MSYSIGKGKLYVGNVKWSNDYANVMLFATDLSTTEAKAQGKTRRNAFMKKQLREVKTNVIWYDPNSFVDIKGRIKSIDNVNYCYYEPDTDILDTPLCCFVTRYEYIAPSTTRLYLELDVFQNYIYDTNLYQSYIERAIIDKSLDSPLYNTLPEPISAQCDVQHELKDDTEHSTGILTRDDWSPSWVLHCASRKVGKEYHYEGNGSSNTFGEYGCYIPNKEKLQSLIADYGRKSPADALGSDPDDKYSNWIADLLTGATLEKIGNLIATWSISDLQDHRDELIGLYGVPKWVIDNYDGDDKDNLDNRNVEKKVNIALNSSHLAVKDENDKYYYPRNKKLLSSICRAYVLANRTGLKIPFKPELFTSDTTTLTLRGIAMSTQGYMYRLSDYLDEQTSYGEVSYNAERRVGFDSNTGLNKMLSLIGAGSQLVSAGVNIGQNIASKDVIGSAQSIGSFIGAGVSAIDQIGTQESHFGSNGDLLRTRGTYSQLHFYEVNPRIDQVRAIDNFFDMYGYTINRHWNIANFTNNRSVWNYVKTQNADLRVYAPANYENQMKQIFNNGVRIWHDYDKYANYSVANN